MKINHGKNLSLRLDHTLIKNALLAHGRAFFIIIFFFFWISSIFPSQIGTTENVAQSSPQIGNSGAEVLIRQWNSKIDADGGLEKFRVDPNHGVVFSGGFPPSWAVDQQLDALNLTKGYGTAGVDPFRVYTKEEALRTSLFKYLMKVEEHEDFWDEKIGPGKKTSGFELLASAKELSGPDILKKTQEYNERKAQRNESWRFFFAQIVPNFVKLIKDPKLLLTFFFCILILVGVPMVIWNFSKEFFKMIFVRRPTILGPKDSDIYGNLLKRLFFKNPSFPRVVANDQLSKELKEVVRINRKVTKHNSTIGWFGSSTKIPYQHILAYGEAGVGKTLFAKKLAKKSGMHFMYLTISDISQMLEEEALRTLKDFFRYARKYGPTVMIIDEFDLLFSKSDIKAQKLAMIFQKEFSKGVDNIIQLFCITNYPDRVPAPFLSRLSQKIFFDRPNLKTKRELFSVHIKRALKSRKKSKSPSISFLNELQEEDVEGLVGRDIESIAVAFVLSEDITLSSLKNNINRFKKAQKNMYSFVYPSSWDREKTQQKKIKAANKTQTWY